MTRKEIAIRYFVASLFAIAGGLSGPLAAAAWHVDGLGAYGLFLAGVAIFVLPPTILTAQIPPRGRRSTSTRQPGLRH